MPGALPRHLDPRPLFSAPTPGVDAPDPSCDPDRRAEPDPQPVNFPTEHLRRAARILAFEPRTWRIIGITASVACAAYLAAALWSDQVLGLLGVAEADRIESHLGGDLGAWFGAALRALIGAAYPIILLPPVLMAVGLFRDEAAPRLLRFQIYAFLLLISLPALLGAMGLLLDSNPGGWVGRTLAGALEEPFGLAGAVILPSAVLLGALAVGLRLEQITRAVAWLILTIGRMLGDTGSQAPRPARQGGAVEPPRELAPGPAQPAVTPEQAAVARDPVTDSPPDVPPRRRSPARSIFGVRASTPAPPPTAPDPPATTPESPASTPEPRERVAQVSRTNTPAPQTALPDLPFAAESPDDLLGNGEPGPPPSAPPDLFLDPPEPKLTTREREVQLVRQGEQLMRILGQYRTKGQLAGKTVGPRVACYHIEMDSGQKVSRFENLEREISLQMQRESVRVVTVPASGAIGVEIPHPDPRIVTFREIYGTDRFPGGANLPLTLGLDVTGRPVIADLTEMPHMLVAGATGSGKSVALNCFLASLIATHPPERLRLLLVDPKLVELDPYRDLPHLRHEVITDPEEASHVLAWAVGEMNRRLEVLRSAGVRQLSEYHEIEGEGDEPLPYLVVVVDELGDLMLGSQGKAVEASLVKLAQKARATGIHLILATQRPTHEIVTGLLTANIPCRAAFQVPRKVDSRVILGESGAERLMGNGDMLFVGSGNGQMERVQGAFISLGEVRNLVNWARQQHPDFELEDDIGRPGDSGLNEAGFPEITPDDSKVLPDALRVCLADGKASTSLLQRRLRIGYGRAARIVDHMEDLGWVDSAQGTSARDVLVGPEVLDDL